MLIDREAYAGLLTAVLPVIIGTDEENERIVAEFGSSNVASAVLNGKRSICKQDARRPAEHFPVPVSLFV